MVLVDSSVWIAYFKGNQLVLPLNRLIDSNHACVNDLIIAELIPSMTHKKEHRLKALLLSMTKITLEINWDRIMQMQILNLRHGINQVGISDLMIAQSAVDNRLEIYTLDKHFLRMQHLHAIKIYSPLRSNHARH